MNSYAIDHWESLSNTTPCPISGRPLTPINP